MEVISHPVKRKGRGNLKGGERGKRKKKEDAASVK